MPNILRAEDIEFLLYDVLDLEALIRTEYFAEGSREVFDQALATAERMAEEKFQPHAAKLDANEPKQIGERVEIIPEVKEAVDAFTEAGFIATAFDAEHGGMQLPFTLAQAIGAWMSAANAGSSSYGGLTTAAANLLAEHGSEEQRATYLPGMLDGRYFGTMVLSEPHAGSSLGDIRTRAEPQTDGTYRVFGNKMWISGGEHDMSENIIHFVLAKVPGGPAGVKGISVFIVPRILADGSHNDIHLASLNHKMGQRGTVNCALNFGEADGAVGYLIGEENKGLAYMFTMMNEMRIAVGLGAAALASTGYLHSLEYARNRTQGRALNDKDPATPMVPIIEHGDVKRMLLQQKAYSEGALALCFFAARLADDIKSGDAETKERAATLLDIMTPIVKSWPSEFGMRANETGLQILGGAGYTRDFPLERFYRDNRINPIHEGTKGIQGLDLLGRKAAHNNGKALRLLLSEIADDADAAAGDPVLSEFSAPLAGMAKLAGETTLGMLTRIGQEGPERVLANATVYLDMLGHVVVAWIWLKQARAAAAAMPGAEGDRLAFLDGKLAACRYFYRYDLPTVETQCALLTQLDTTCLEMDAAGF